ncbi:lipoyl(octanoyl) transferase [Rhodobium orientis]|uniref:Octanoyltransferase n=1 Tax=Rhodobium orientis TaxID=34017 RepID=A0A327JNE9_9HYPH|nr:lipoyl(octanoyl) transferase LipB [Rhodobium orientis]MBB4301562.1 lipoyl(octanoyl) transferase [Rhodobium orientis]MBK5952258.1 lipoate-protein ligase B [Rhodobium orientis]RAI24948.1 lipoate-protein ligase B [Rhodobium orientis]
MVNARTDPGRIMVARAGAPPVEWAVTDAPVSYPDAIAAMEARVAEIAEGTAPERVWLLEHPPLYTAGTSAIDTDLLTPERFPVYRTGRGGQFTYHGPGQRIAYVMLDLKRRRQDVRAYIEALEEWIIRTLWRFHIRGERRDDRVGVWVRRPDKGPDAEDKIAAIGVRVRRWTTFHGIAINVDPVLEHFSGIVPCGVTDHGVTSLVDLGLPVTLSDLDIALKAEFAPLFGPLETATD